MSADLTRFFAPRAIAIVGASGDASKIGGRPLRYLLDSNFSGQVFPVNPNRGTVLGVPAYPTIADIPGTIDHAIIAVGDAHVEAALRASAAKGATAATIFTSGYAEIGEAGRAAQHRLTALARELNIRILGPNCQGFANVADGVIATFSSGIERAGMQSGPVAIISQSGVVSSVVYALARQAGAPFRVVSSRALFGSPPHLAFNFDARNPDLARLFSDVRWRQAIQMAVNRQRIIDDVYNGLAELPGHGIAPISSWYFDTRRFLGKFDLPAAGRALDELGLRLGADGVRQLPSGRPLEFTLTYGTDSAVWPAMATILQNDLKQIGVRANLQGILSRTLLSTGLSGNFEALLLAFGDQPDPELRKPIWQPGGALYYWHRATLPPTPGGDPNFAAMQPWERQTYDIWEAGGTTVSRPQRKALYDRWQVLFAQNLPVIMIAKPTAVGAIHDRYRNYIYSLGVIPGHNPVPLIYQK